MKFGAVSPDEAEGGIVVHSIRTDGLVLKKGTVVGKAEIAALKAAGIAVSHGRAASSRAMCRKTSPPATSLPPSRATACGSIGVHRPLQPVCRDRRRARRRRMRAIDRLNEIDPDITLATLDAFAPVVPGKMIATVKIIPFAIVGAARDAAVKVAREAEPLVRVAPYISEKGRR